MKEIEKIIKAYDQIDWQKEKAALGTVVKVEESAYRRIGARMLVSSAGYWTGGISGGCLEGDALKRAQIAINKDQSSIVVYDTMDDDSHEIGVGLGCNGRIEVLFSPVNPDNNSNPIEYLRTIISSRDTNTLLQVLSNDDIRNELLGTFYPADRIHKLIEKTGLNKSDIEESIAYAFEKQKSKVFQLTSKTGSHYEILVELIKPKIKLICIGDNYDVNAFVDIANELGWQIHVAGKMRKLSKAVFRLSKTVCTYEEAPKISLDPYTAVVLMSHDYKTDIELLKFYISQDVPYIGLLGPRKRMLKMQTELSKDLNSVNLESQPNLFAPVGLDIGAESPEEIALSITSEIVATLRHRDGRALKFRKGPIHERD